MLAAKFQFIVFEEFIPVLLGEPLPPYTGYNSSANPSVDLVFSTAFYRLGHTMIPETLPYINAQLEEVASISLRQSFFAPHRLLDHGGLDDIFRGLMLQHAQELDFHLVDGLRTILFGPMGSGIIGGSDLAAINIQRGRDHALPDYNAARRLLGLPIKSNWSSVTR